MNLILTNSATSAYRTCPRLYFWRHEALIRLRERPLTLRWGTLIHHALDAVWSGARAADAITEASAEFRGADAGLKDEHWLDAARATMAYYAAYHRAAAPLEVIQTEQTFTAPLINPETNRRAPGVDIAGKIDKIVRDADGRLWIVDHKTTAEDPTDFAGSFWTRLLIDSQPTHYLWLARLNGLKIEGILYDVLRKPGIRPKDATPIEDRKYTQGKPEKVDKKTGEITPAEPPRLYANQRDTDESPTEFAQRWAEAIEPDPQSFFVRRPVPRLDSDVEEYARELWQTYQSIRLAQKGESWYRNCGSCVRWGRECEYLSACAGMEDPRESDRFEKIDQAHPELGEI